MLTVGVLGGIPFGCIAILVGNKSKHHVKLIAKSTIYIIIKIDDKLIVNIYLPCQNTNEIEDEHINCIASQLNEICTVRFKCTTIGNDGTLTKTRIMQLRTKSFVHDPNSVYVDFKLTNKLLFFIINHINRGHYLSDHFVVSKALINDICNESNNDNALNL